MTVIYIRLWQLHITFSVLSMLTLHWKFVAFSLIYSKAFDRIWHDGLLYTLKSNGYYSNSTDYLQIVYKTTSGLRWCSLWSAFKWCFSNKLEIVQYNTASAITEAIKGTSREKLYQELGLEYPQQRRWMRRLCLFYTVNSTKLPTYIYNCLRPVRQSRRHPNIFTSFSYRTKYFKN